ncbi:hypothetical protein, partial [Wolbachia endosymbiont of Pentidionis agamae]|uniref:hypothetical protein n=1 Tax=Wolbachia endosymbiont of Pentidionis agamae TaxID=3110435 RepID=UPI002FD23831
MPKSELRKFKNKVTKLESQVRFLRERLSKKIQDQEFEELLAICSNIKEKHRKLLEDAESKIGILNNCKEEEPTTVNLIDKEKLFCSGVYHDTQDDELEKLEVLKKKLEESKKKIDSYQEKMLRKSIATANTSTDKYDQLFKKEEEREICRIDIQKLRNVNIDRMVVSLNKKCLESTKENIKNTGEYKKFSRNVKLRIDEAQNMEVLGSIIEQRINHLSLMISTASNTQTTDDLREEIISILEKDGKTIELGVDYMWKIVNKKQSTHLAEVTELEGVTDQL